MLPMLPSLASLAGVLARLRRLLVSGALAACLLLPLGLSGCNGTGQPPHGVLLQALALQIQLTQGAIAQALALESVGMPELNRVRVEQQQAVRIGEAKGLRLAGRFDWRLPGDPIRVDSPFELYLQRGERGQSWRLARPSGSGDGTTQEWLTYPLPLPGAATG
ncbi:MAG: hypothetical protein ACKO7Z_11590 [Cyanobacteriota bacterium]